MGLILERRRIVFFGDSITEMGLFPNGYIHLVQSYLNSNGLEKQYELTGAGVSGNKVYDLYLRLQEDVLDRHPALVVIFIGINDVWHKTSGTGTDIEKFEKFYVAIITKLLAGKIELALCTPTVIGEKKHHANPQDADLDAYAAVIRKLAHQYKCRLIDLRKVFTTYINNQNLAGIQTGILTTDSVHLNDTGNHIVAAEMIKSILS